MKSTLFSLAVLVLGLGEMADDPSPNEAKSRVVEQSVETLAGTWEIMAV